MEKATKKSSLKPKLQKAKAKVASAVHGQPAKDLKIIAITGHTGKDAVASFIQKILVAHKVPTALITSPTKDPITTYALHRYLGKSLRSGAIYVVIEAPATVLKKHVFHQLPIHMAVLTNTDATDTDTIASKSRLFKNSPPFIVLNRDDPSYDQFAAFPAKTNTVTFGQHKESTVHINRSKLYGQGTEANLTSNSATFDVATFLVGEEAVSLMAAATAVATLLDIPADAIVEGIASYEPQDPHPY